MGSNSRALPAKNCNWIVDKGKMHMAKISLLNEETINQIAAGEVIEDPASVVKELVENAIDAGASHIIVDITGGGHKLIRVSDNGSGMSGEDAMLCLKRHATSKIRKADDLLNLLTMGFRGEALAAIASVSRLNLMTSTEEDAGTQIEVEGSSIKHCQPCARQRGTTIEVSDLFFNTPARQKFQKSSSASSAEITKIMTLLSLAHPEVSLELNQQGRAAMRAFSTPSILPLETLKLRIEEIFTTSYSHSSRSIVYQDDILTLRGWLQLPEHSRHNRSGQYLFINNRPVNCPSLSYAIKEGYGTRIGQDRFPAFVLHASMDSKWLDVNVHPQKKEVRIRDEPHIRKVVREAIDKALIAQTSPIEKYSFLETYEVPLTQQWQQSFAEHIQPVSRIEEWEQISMPQKEVIRPIGLFKNFLLLERNGMCLIDLLGLQERIAFDILIKKERGQNNGQRLLLPVIMTLPPHHMAQLDVLRTRLEDLGILFTTIGRNQLSIDSAPDFLNEENVALVMESCLQDPELLIEGMTDTKKIVLKLIKGIRLRKKPFMLQESLTMVEKLWSCPEPWETPFGKPIAVVLSEERLTKLIQSG